MLVKTTQHWTRPVISRATVRATHTTSAARAVVDGYDGCHHQQGPAALRVTPCVLGDHALRRGGAR